MVLVLQALVILVDSVWMFLTTSNSISHVTEQGGNVKELAVISLSTEKRDVRNDKGI